MGIRSFYLSAFFASAVIALAGCSDDSSTSSGGEQPPTESSSSISSEPISNEGSSESGISSPVAESAETVNSSSRVESSGQGTSSSGTLAESSAESNSSSPSSSGSSSSAPTSSVVQSETSSATLPESAASVSLLDFDFYMGADISTVQEYERNKTKVYDVDGTASDFFTVLKNHGFNTIRLKTFVDPKAKYGYAASGCGHEAEAYADKDHIVAYAQKIKAAGMAFLLDIHYSDNWADPGKQIIPERWRKVGSSDALADSVYAYTLDLMNALKQVNAVPEMVQIGNETTPGILVHVPNNSTDCWGNGVDKASTAINGDMGTASGKANAAKYFKAGIRAVKEVSPSTKTVLHIERIRQANTVTWWMTEIFKNQKVPADVMGFSAYTAYGDGAPDNWKSLFQTVTSSYPDLEFMVVEYNGGDKDNHYNYDGSRKRTNEMIKGMERWIGTFFWEPTLSGAWGPALFDWKGNDLQANSRAFEEFPAK
ncbi:MAG: glycosyl hydrolase 53 family protein [Fibrobacter sp.]|nr:glycosyl hydrolase 53 family protein [Fibrobacter sp.]